MLRTTVAEAIQHLQKLNPNKALWIIVNFKEVLNPINWYLVPKEQAKSLEEDGVSENDYAMFIESKPTT